MGKGIPGRTRAKRCKATVLRRRRGAAILGASALRVPEDRYGLAGGFEDRVTTTIPTNARGTVRGTARSTSPAPTTPATSHPGGRTRRRRHDDAPDTSRQFARLAEVPAGPERERRLLCLRFFREMTQSRIAEHLGISQMQVSRLLSRTCARLHEEREGAR
ncbi:sigma-70 family RNA polymerase sigma factor [Streptomyces hoynatensis]|uniref:Sigma-70 family RNA polymerase sigma factor n=1 Tax=Streptomyces hoynatensis TaxID=1141874 RepID=A0A3A9Z414_9ACTN|nr:sigma-70 family RNA polymerase sigma factor [Streptomyces hoynatensis]